MKLHIAKVPRKGKGAKGFNEIESFGVPVLDDAGIAKDFSYDFLKDKQFMVAMQELADFVISHNKMTTRALLESTFRGVDDTLRSNTLRHELAVTELSEWILAQDLAENETQSKEVASLWAQTMEFQKKCGVLVLSKEDFAASRTKFVQVRKDAGVWKMSLTPAVQLENKTIGDVIQSSIQIAPVTTTENQVREALGIPPVVGVGQAK